MKDARKRQIKSMLDAIRKEKGLVLVLAAKNVFSE